jgi:hypothetical protein
MDKQPKAVGAMLGRPVAEMVYRIDGEPLILAFGRQLLAPAPAGGSPQPLTARVVGPQSI